MEAVSKCLNIAALRNEPYNPGTTTTVYVQGYYYPGDGGGGIFNFVRMSDFTSHPFPTEDNGIFINSWIPMEEPGIWVRSFSGYIDMRFYGITNLDGGGNITDQLQSAINYAARSHEDVSARIWFHNNSNTVFIPNGSFAVTKITMKSGVHLLGASMNNTQIKSLNQNDPYLIDFEYNNTTRNIRIENIKFWGNADTIVQEDFEKGKLIHIKGCFGFVSPREKPIEGGLWESVFRNITIQKFTGDSIRFECELGLNQWFRTNQWITMENVFVESVGELAAKFKDFNNEYHALAITGNNGQFVFTNCRFDGGSYLFNEEGEQVYRVNGTNVYIGSSMIENASNPVLVPCPTIITFNTCTIQSGANGFIIESSHNIKIDGCWFENLERSIIAKGRYNSSKAINVLNNMFSFAAGNFGGYPANTGRVIVAQNSQVNACNNYVIDVEQKEFTAFIALDNEIVGDKEEPTTNLGVNGYGNYFEPNQGERKYLGNTWKMVKEIKVIASSVDFMSARAIHLVYEGQATFFTIDKFSSYDITSDYIYIFAKKGNFKLTESRNLYLGNQDLDLKEGDSAFFIKTDDQYDKTIDNETENFYERYNLVAHLPKV